MRPWSPSVVACGCVSFEGAAKKRSISPCRVGQSLFPMSDGRLKDYPYVVIASRLP